MPELPEVEAARRAVEENCIGKKIKRAVVADDPKVVDGVSPSEFQLALVGKTIVAAHRKGKNMWLELDSPPFPSFQFGMAGAIYIKGVAVTQYKRSAVNDTDEWPSKYSKIFMELDDGLELSFTDKRRFARVRLLKDPASAPPISELGPDALLEPMTKDELFNSLSKKKIGIKALLLDQSYISGVGNWIADEVLYQARIHPLQVAASISKESCSALHKCIKEVIEKAVEVGADSSQFPSSWIFHSREKKPGKAFVDGKKIEFINAGGRTTAYVPEMQKLSGAQASKPPGKAYKGAAKKANDDDDNDENDDDGGDLGGEEEQAKSKKSRGKSTVKSKAKKPPAKSASKSSKDDSEDHEIDDVHQEEQTKGNKKPPAKRKSSESRKADGQLKKGTKASKRKPMESDTEHDDTGDDEDVEDEEDQVKATKKKQIVDEKSSEKVQTGKQSKKRAK